MGETDDDTDQAHHAGDDHDQVGGGTTVVFASCDMASRLGVEYDDERPHGADDECGSHVPTGECTELPRAEEGSGSCGSGTQQRGDQQPSVLIEMRSERRSRSFTDHWRSLVVALRSGLDLSGSGYSLECTSPSRTSEGAKS